MVEGADALLSLAEFAVALAGFMGVVMVFRRPEADLHPYDSHRIKISLATTLSPAFLALLPAGLSLSGLSNGILWGLCSSLGALVSIGCLALETCGRRRLPSAAKALISPTVVRIFQVLLGLSLALHVINLSAFSFEPRAGLYFLALVLSLGFGAVAFVRVVFIQPRGPAA